MSLFSTAKDALPILITKNGTLKILFLISYNTYEHFTEFLRLIQRVLQVIKRNKVYVLAS